MEVLTPRNPELRRWWSEHRVYQRTFGSKRVRHPLAVELAVQYESLTLPGVPDQMLYVYTTEAGTASRATMDVLVSWVGTTVRR